jgi:hypothetical protein
MSMQRLVIFFVLLVVVLTAAQLGAADSEVSGIFKGQRSAGKTGFCFRAQRHAGQRQGNDQAGVYRGRIILIKERVPGRAKAIIAGKKDS